MLYRMWYSYKYTIFKSNTALHLFVLMYLTDILVKRLKLEGIFLYAEIYCYILKL
jgi:hypothetical protein